MPTFIEMLTPAAQLNVRETGIDPADDIYALREGRVTRASLLESCLDGADQDRVEGWREYVDAVVRESGVAFFKALCDIAARSGS